MSDEVINDDYAEDEQVMEGSEDGEDGCLDGLQQENSSRSARQPLQPLRKLGIAWPMDGECSFCKPAAKVTKSNWARHMQRKHPEIIREHEEALSSQQSQTKLPTSAAFPSKASRVLTLYAATTTMPLQHVENRYFKELLSKVPHLKVPDRRTLGKQIDHEVRELQKTLRKYLVESDYQYSFGVDISTTKGMLVSFLGITAHVWARNNQCVRAFALDMTPLVERHIAEYVFKVFNDTLASHKLTDQKALRIVTDCGSNMVKAFYEPFRVDGEVQDPGYADIFFVDRDDVFFVDRDDEEMEQLELGQLEEEALEDVTLNFSYIHNKHLKCAIHRIESAMRAVFKTDDEMIHLRKRVFKKIGPFARSHKLTKQLYENYKAVSGNGLKILFPNNTRWSTLAIVYVRVQKLRPSIAKVSYDNGVNDLAASDYRAIDNVLKVVLPIRRFEQKLQQESVPTISLVYSGIHGLLDMLEKLKMFLYNEEVLTHVCTSLQSELTSRFSDVLSSGEDGSDPIYIVAACLDPLVAHTTCLLDEKLDTCRSAIKEMAKLLIDEYDGSSVVIEEMDTITGSDVFGFDIPAKKKRMSAHMDQDKVEVEHDEYRFLLQQPVNVTAAEF